MISLHDYSTIFVVDVVSIFSLSLSLHFSTRTLTSFFAMPFLRTPSKIDIVLNKIFPSMTHLTEKKGYFCTMEQSYSTLLQENKCIFKLSLNLHLNKKREKIKNLLSPFPEYVRVSRRRNVWASSEPSNITKSVTRTRPPTIVLLSKASTDSETGHRVDLILPSKPASGVKR